MFHPLAVYIGLRYTRAKRRNHFISFISLVSMVGMALGITALITVLSVMNGFQEEIRGRILSMTAHATVSRWGEPLQDWRQLDELLRQYPVVKGVAPLIDAQAMLNNGSLVSGVKLLGILPEAERRVTDLAAKMVEGSLDDLKPSGYGIILGRALAASLGVQVGDMLTVVTPQVNSTPAGILPRLKRFQVVGIFFADMYQYDGFYAYVHLDDAARLFRTGEGVSSLQLRFDDPFQAIRMARDLDTVLADEGYRVRDWTQDHASYFRAVQIEKTAMFIIMTLIVAVAAFNIVSTLVMVVTDKQSDIAILRTLGITPGGVMGVFMVQGITIGLVGTLLGVIGGVSLALNVDVVVPFLERVFGIKFLAPDVYFLSDLPSKVMPGDVAVIALVAFSLSALATLYPAWRAARTQPAEALRYE
ncbi:MAG TPA: lipoprotein-releasing ABC transporter permease subunit [Candidatus Competibacteraceae bacterium]|nr:lipoprotein-releasing ABC transporter permease subunit [Candidatus Competibacteraceae bacterium]